MCYQHTGLPLGSHTPIMVILLGGALSCHLHPGRDLVSEREEVVTLVTPESEGLHVMSPKPEGCKKIFGYGGGA